MSDKPTYSIEEEHDPEGKTWFRIFVVRRMGQGKEEKVQRTLHAGGGPGGFVIDGVTYPARLGGKLQTVEKDGHQVLELVGAEPYDWTWWSSSTGSQFRGAHSREEALKFARDEVQSMSALHGTQP